MMSEVTEQVGLAAWQERLCQSFFGLDVKPLGTDARLHATITDKTKGYVQASTVEVRADPHLVRRTFSRDEEASLLVSVQLRGTCVVRQEDREAVLRPGDIALYDASRPYDLVFPGGDHRQAVLVVPPAETKTRDLLLRHTAVRVSGGQGTGFAVSALMSALPGSIQDTAAPHAEQLAQSALDLLALSFTANPAPGHVEELLDRARVFIEAHADDPGLNPGRIATGLYVSLAQLHRTFRGSDTTVSSLVKQVRLDRAARDLRDERLRSWTVADIGARRGFSDAAHFSRSFTARFGVPPGHWRKLATDQAVAARRLTP